MTLVVLLPPVEWRSSRCASPETFTIGTSVKGPGCLPSGEGITTWRQPWRRFPANAAPAWTSISGLKLHAVDKEATTQKRPAGRDLGTGEPGNRLLDDPGPIVRKRNVLEEKEASVAWAIGLGGAALEICPRRNARPLIACSRSGGFEGETLPGFSRQMVGTSGIWWLGG